MLRIALVACDVLERELSFEIAQTESIVHARWLHQGLHDTPELLRKQLQQEIDRIEEEQKTFAPDKKYDAVCFGYGICSNGVIGLRTGTLPLVIPRCDDCISLFLGSAERYCKLFDQHPGTYWYSPGWIEHAFTPSEKSYEVRFRDYAGQYGEDNAAFLMEAEREWVKDYRKCIYIDSPVYQNPEYEAYARQAAADFGWEFRRECGDQTFLKELLSGNWDEERFLLCPPGNTVSAEYSEMKLRAVQTVPDIP